MKTVIERAVGGSEASPFVVTMPAGASVVAVAATGGVPSRFVIWIECDMDIPVLETRVFQFHRTGEPVPDSHVYRGTVFGEYTRTAHLYEKESD